MSLTEGSLCTGYNGLGIAVASVLGTELAWVSEVDPSACAVVNAHYPGVANLGDLTVIDWSKVEPVDVLTAGYPCQPFSTAGRRQGANDARHLWPYIAEAIRLLRPGLVVLENVAGHLSLGFGDVLGDLAEIGFDAEWCVVRASDVGACHRRARLFVVAHAVVDHGRRGDDVPQPSGGCELRDTPRGDALAGGVSALPRGAAADAGSQRRDGGSPVEGTRWPAPERGQAGDHAGDGAGPRIATDSSGDARRLSDRDGQAAPNAGGCGWGAYGPAIARHAAVLGRPAPDPVDGRGRLNPVFVEWMMMLPGGWVTDVVTNRSAALKCLGNGVVPPQAAYALDGLLTMAEAA